MSDLMGRKLLPAATPQVPYSLHEFADEEEQSNRQDRAPSRRENRRGR